MAQTYTLEEAAHLLGVAPEEMKARLKGDWGKLRAFRDGTTLRFRAPDIDELARSLGLGSNPDLHTAGTLADAPLALADDRPPGAKKDDTSDFFEVADQDVKLGTPGRGRKAGDSDVRLEAPSGTGGGGKSSRRHPPPPRQEVDLDLDSKDGTDEDVLALPPEPLAPKSGRITGPKTPKRADGSSEFELKLEDSSSEFELSLSSSSEEEVDIGAKAQDSGINLDKPNDSGVSLEAASDSEIDFELSLDPVGSGKSTPAPASGRLRPPVKKETESSEFELTLDGDATAAGAEAVEQKDIFETDFEIPALDDDSGSEVVALDESSDTDLESSDFDLAEAESASSEESAALTAAVDSDEAEAVRPGKKGKKKTLVADDEEADEDLDEDEEVAAPRRAPAVWGAGALVPLAIGTPLLALVTLMSTELVGGIQGYKSASPFMKMIAPLMGAGGEAAVK